MWISHRPLSTPEVRLRKTRGMFLILSLYHFLFSLSSLYHFLFYSFVSSFLIYPFVSFLSLCITLFVSSLCRCLSSSSRGYHSDPTSVQGLPLQRRYVIWSILVFLYYMSLFLYHYCFARRIFIQLFIFNYLIILSSPFKKVSDYVPF